MRLSKSKNDLIFDIFNYFFMSLVIIIMVYPFYDTIMLSLSSRMDSIDLSFKFMPKEFTLASYKKVLSQSIMKDAYFNTIFRTAVGTSLSVLLCFVAAYPLSRPSLPLRKTITFFLVFTMFFSGGLIPNYLLIKKLDLINNRWVYILPTLYSVWNIVIMRNFLLAVPKELEEAAIIDGAGPIRIIVNIMFPLSKPVIATVALWVSVWHWNSWFDSVIYITETRLQVVQLILRRIVLLEQIRDLIPGMDSLLSDTTVNTTESTIKAATIIVATAPILFVYPFAQKYFIKGVMVGSLKG